MNVDDLEGAINSAKAEPTPTTSEAPKMSQEEEIGFHKGALNVLIAERNELAKMVGNVESIMQAHIARLKEMGVDLK
jgi:hypothetical protein